MDWIESEETSDPELAVENQTDGTQQVTVGCRTEAEVIFREQVTLAPSDTDRWSELPADPFEIGISIADGPTDSETFDPADDVGEITAALTDDGVSFAAGAASGIDIDGDASGDASATDASTASDGHTDEAYCRSCGTPIKRQAEICPECGVPNAARATAANGSGAGAPAATGATAANGGGAGAPAAAGVASGSTGTQSATQASTASEPSGSWVNGVRLGAVLWFGVILILVPLILSFQNSMAGGGVRPGGAMQSLGLAALLPPVQLLAWIVLPVSMYLDLKYVDYHVEDWPLNSRLYLAAAAILPILTQLIGAAALFTGGGFFALVIPVLLLALSIRYLRARSRALSAPSSA